MNSSPHGQGGREGITFLAEGMAYAKAQKNKGGNDSMSPQIWMEPGLPRGE